MNLLLPNTPPASSTAHRPARRRGRKETFEAAHSLLAQGESMIWLTGGALVLSLAMISGLVLLVLSQGAPTFWPRSVVRVTTMRGETWLGEITRREQYRPTLDQLASEVKPGDEMQLAELKGKIEAQQGVDERFLVRTENSELSSNPFHWVNGASVTARETPEWAMVFERLEHGRFYGELVGYKVNGKEDHSEPAAAWKFFQSSHGEVRERWRKARHLETHDLGQLDARLESARLAERMALLDQGAGSPELAAVQANFQKVASEVDEASQRIRGQIKELRDLNDSYELLVKVSAGDVIALKMENIVRAYPANQLSFSERLAIYVARWWEFLTDEPRNVNTEGGVFPAVFGTVVMTLIMSLAVAPFGVLAALYLREYARAGFVVSLVRIAINNLAGVPSIVFGVFGLGFFCYQLGSYIDGGPTHAQIPVLPPASWFLAVGALAISAVSAFALGAWSMAPAGAQPSLARAWMSRGAMLLWLVFTGLLVFTIATTPYFHGFFRGSLPNPTFGTGGVLWSALTLSLLTLPVVIVATEEALSAVPNSLREGSYACGAGKWQTIRRIVLPHAMPGIMTGLILAMSRGAGEVAPLMLVGALKFAPKLAIDGEFPFVHPQRPFMHLAFHIFDLGFHSPNSEASKPTVYTTILLLIVIVAALNLMAVWLRSRLRKAFQQGQF